MVDELQKVYSFFPGHVLYHVYYLLALLSLRSSSADACNIPEEEIDIVERQLALFFIQAEPIGKASFCEFRQKSLVLVGRYVFFEVVVVDQFGSDAYFDFLVDVGHEAVEFIEVGGRQAAAKGVDGLFLFEVAGDGLKLREEVDCLIEAGPEMEGF